MSGWTSATILRIEESDEMCGACFAPKYSLVLRIEANPPDGCEVGDEVAATECCDRACPDSYIRKHSAHGWLDG